MSVSDDEFFLSHTEARTTDRRATGLLFELLTVLCVTVLPFVVLSIQQNLSSRDSRQFVGGDFTAMSYSVLRCCSGLLLFAYVTFQRGETLRHFGWRIRLAVIPGSFALFALAMATYVGVFVCVKSISATGPGEFAGPAFEGIRQGTHWFLLPSVFLSPLFEETVVRAYVMTRIRDIGWHPSWAVVASTLVQVSYHVHKGLAFAPAFGAMFLVFSLCFARYRNLPVIVLAHMYIDIVWWASR